MTFVNLKEAGGLTEQYTVTYRLSYTPSKNYYKLVVAGSDCTVAAPLQPLPRRPQVLMLCSTLTITQSNKARNAPMFKKLPSVVIIIVPFNFK